MVELRWEGKYTPDGKKAAPVRLALPFQDVETVNESAQTRNLMLDFWARNQPTEWRNRLIWGDKKYVLPSLLPDFAGKVNLIYIDPPFATGDDFSYSASIPDDLDTEGDQGATFTKQPSMLEQKAYRDTWGRGLDGYLHWFYDTVVVLHELLAEKGSIYVHLDWHVGHYAKLVLDEVFGLSNFQNCIIWKRGPGKSHPKSFGHNVDYILFYTKSEAYTWNKQFTEVSDEYLQSFKDDSRGKYVTTPLHSGKPAKSVPVWRGVKPPSGRGWAYTIETLEKFDEEGRIEWSSNGIPRLKRYLNEIEGSVVQELWTDIKPLLAKSGAHIGYPTQKPEELLERVISASSDEGDLVLDCFCGSGTTAAVAERLRRRWIAADLGRFAIHTTRKRLLSLPDVRPFVVQNLGKYERQAWQAAEFGQDKEKAALAQARYRRFILDLYGAEPLDGYNWLHGTKAGRFVHVGAVDAPVTSGDVMAIGREFWKAVGHDSGASINKVDVLGWDFAFQENEMGKQLAAEANINLVYKKIPREVLEKKAVDQGDIRFYELAALSTQVTAEKGRTVRVDLCDFIVHPDDVPEEVQKAITHWSQYIDYWAIDWDYKGDTFHNQWQSYRTKKSPKLQLSATNTYDVRGTYRIVVKVIDILGNDTTKALEVEVQ